MEKKICTNLLKKKRVKEGKNVVLRKPMVGQAA